MLLAEQQPGHDVPPHPQVPPEQASPALHELHAAPPVPHWLPDWEGNVTQVPLAPPLQQPSGHEVASQTHCPVVLLHSCPGEHPAGPHGEATS